MSPLPSNHAPFAEKTLQGISPYALTIRERGGYEPFSIWTKAEDSRRQRVGGRLSAALHTIFPSRPWYRRDGI